MRNAYAAPFGHPPVTLERAFALSRARGSKVGTQNCCLAHRKQGKVKRPRQSAIARLPWTYQQIPSSVGSMANSESRRSNSANPSHGGINHGNSRSSKETQRRVRQTTTGHLAISASPWP